MRIFWVKIPKELQWLVALWIIWLWFWLYENIALVSIIILVIIFFTLFLYWLSKILNIDNYVDDSYSKSIWIILLLLSLFPWYFGLYIILNYDESNKYLQEKSFSGFVEIGQFAIKWRSFTAKNILKEARDKAVESAKEEAITDAINQFWNEQWF